MKNSPKKTPRKTSKKQTQRPTNKVVETTTTSNLSKIQSFARRVRKSIHPTRKDKVFLTIFAITAVLTFIMSIINSLRPASPRISTININGHSYKVLTASTLVEQQRGLMNIRKPVSYDGMQFVFSQTATQKFWNKNTHLDLIIFWLKKGQLVGTTDLPSIDHSGLITVTSPQPVDKAVEIIK